LEARLVARQTPPALLIVLSGPSGVGKDTIIQKMRDLGLPMHYAITATTRNRRPGEIDGFHYYFLPVEEFQQKQLEGEFLEYAEVYGYWYGPPKQPIRDAVARGQDVLLKIDVQGARSVRRIAPDALFVFLAPPSIKWLRDHLRARKTETPEKLREREAAAIAELEAASEFDHVVVNRDHDVEGVVREIIDILNQERLNRGPLTL
jgi:guanylate kinase